MSGSLTVTDGTNFAYDVGTITLSTAGTVSSDGSSNATITGSVQVYLPGGLGTDTVTSGASSTIGNYDIASRTGSTINITWFENNSEQGTGGLYLTPGPVGATRTVDVDTILAASLSYSSTKGVAIYVPAGTYQLAGIDYNGDRIRQTLATNTTLIGAPGFQTIFALAYSRNGSEGAFLVSGDNVVVQDIMVSASNASYVNFWTNQPVTVTGAEVTASLFDWQTVSIGDLGGVPLILDGGWPLDAELLPSQNAGTIYFTSLPAGYTDVDTLRTDIIDSAVLWNYCIERGVTVNNVTEEGSGTYALALNGVVSGTKTLTVTRDAFTPRPDAVNPVAQTISNPDYLAQQALPVPALQFARNPAYYTGDYFHITGAFATFRNVACVGVTSGSAYYGNCLSPRFTNTHCLATFGAGGSAGFRFVGLGAIFDGCVSNSGDDGIQQSQQPAYDPHYLNTLNNPSYAFTGSTFAERWIGCDITTMGTGRACAIVLDSSPNGKPLTWPSNSTTFSPSSVQFSASDAPARLTLSLLGTSQQPWAPSFTYETMDTLVVNKGHLYSLYGTGTSASSGGPSSTSTTSTITDGSCSWTYVSAGESIYIYDSALAGTYPGAYVTGYTESDGTVTVTATAPLVNFTGTWTTTTEPFTDYTSGTDFIFLLSSDDGNAASPPMIMDNSVDIQLERCTLRSVNAIVANIANRNSFGTARVAFHGCTFDGSWSVDPSDTDAMMTIIGNPIAGSGGAGAGGCRVMVDGCRFYTPAYACVSSLGVNCYISISRSELYPPHIVMDQMANVLIAGAAQFDFVENTVWAPPSIGTVGSYTAGVVNLGAAPTTYFGLALPGNVSNARIVGNRFMALYADAANIVPGLKIDYADTVLVSNNIFASSASPTVTTMTGINITSNATNIISVGNSFETCPVAYSGTLTQLSINGNEIYDSGGEGYVKPPAPSYPGLTSSVGTWTPSLSCAMNPDGLSVVYDTGATGGTIIRTALSDGTYKNDIQFTVAATGSLIAGSAGSGDMRLEGLPYASTSATGQGVGVCPPMNDFNWGTYTTGMLVWVVEPNETFLLLNNMSSGNHPDRLLISTIFSTSTTESFTLSGFGYYLSID